MNDGTKPQRDAHAHGKPLTVAESVEENRKRQARAKATPRSKDFGIGADAVTLSAQRKSDGSGRP
jgi:hypothetical protein